MRPEGQVKPAVDPARAKAGHCPRHQPCAFHRAAQFARLDEHGRIMRTAWQKAQQIFGDGDSSHSRQRVAVDCVKQKQRTGAQGACHLGQNLVQVAHMFQHIDANHGIETAVSIGQGLTRANIISDAQALRAGMGA